VRKLIGLGRDSQRSPRAASGAASSGGALVTTTINGVPVLTTAKGFTVHSFAPDSATTSNCNGQCARFWPPVKGWVTAGSGVTGTLGTITRSDGATQATYNGHPLYTSVGDNHPGQANGNNLNLNGGLWHEVTITQ
jgi:predicted lipoprotein with Yx(FWY)xxD motif